MPNPVQQSIGNLTKQNAEEKSPISSSIAMLPHLTSDRGNIQAPTGSGIGESKYDYNITPTDVESGNLGYIRHYNQPGMSRLANAGVNLVGKAAAYLGQTAGFILGAPVALATWDITNMTDNFLDRASDELKDKVSEEFPIYKGKKYTEGTIWDKLGSSDWWLDDAIDRAALTVSMLAPGTLAVKGIGIANLMTKGLEVLSPAELKGFGNAMEFATTAAKAGKPLEGVTPELVGWAKNLTKGELFTQNMISQAGLSSRETQIAIKKSLVADRELGKNKLSDTEIQKKSVDGAIATFWENVPAALISSAVELPQIFSTFNSQKNLFKKAFDSFGNPIPVVEKTLGQNIAHGFLKAAGTGLEHGQVENLQVAIGKYNEDLQEGKTHDNASEGILKAFINDFSDENGQNNIALGTIQGIITSALGGVGHTMRIRNGKEVSETQQIHNLQDYVNSTLLNYRQESGSFVKKDAQGKTLLDENNRPISDVERITSTILDMYGSLKNSHDKQMAVAGNDKLMANWADHNALMKLAFGYFSINGGVDHLNNILELEKKETEKNPEHSNDIDAYGNEISLDNVLADKKETIKRLQKVNNLIQGVKVDLGDATQLSKEDIERAPTFINKIRFALYNTASTQMFLSKQKDKNLAEISDLSSGLSKDIPANKQRIKEIEKENENIDNLFKEYSKNYTSLTNKNEVQQLFKNTAEQDKTIKEQAATNADITTAENTKKTDTANNNIIKKKQIQNYYTSIKNAVTEKNIQELTIALKKEHFEDSEKLMIQKMLEDKSKLLDHESKLGTTFIVEHGVTQENKETAGPDLVRTKTSKLSREGIQEAHELAEKVNKQPISHIISSPINRAQETSDIISKKTGRSKINHEGLATWDLGNFEGQPRDSVKKQLNHYIDNPDEKVPGGESFNTFKNRFLKAFKESITKDTISLLVTHSSGLKLLKAWIAAGQKSNFAIDKSVYKEDANTRGELIQYKDGKLSIVKDKEDPSDETFTEDPSDILSQMGSENELSSEEKLSLQTNANTKKDEKPDGYIDPLTSKIKDSELSLIETAIENQNDLGETISPQGLVVTDGELIVQASSAFAYLTKEYTEELVKRGQGFVHKIRTASDDLNKDMQEPLLLSQNHYQPGEEVTLELDTTFNITINEETGTLQSGDTIVPLKQKKNITYADLADDVMRVPIRIVNKDGKTIAYLHDIDFITSRRVASRDNNIEEQRTILTAIRQYVFDNKSIKTKIVSKSLGKLSISKENKDKPLNEVIKNPSIQFTVARNNTLYTSEGEHLTTNILNSNFKDGLTYMITPTPVKGINIALPVFNTMIGEERANQLANAIELFLNKDNNIVKEQIADLTGNNIYTSDGLRAYLKQFAVVGNFDQGTLNAMVGQTSRIFLDVTSTGIKWGRGGDMMRDINKIEYFNREDFISTIKEAYNAIYKAELGNKSYRTPTINNDSTVNNIEQSYTDYIKSVTTSNIVENKLGEGEYSYFDQPVINFDLAPFITTNKQRQVESKENDFKPTFTEEAPNELGDLNIDEVDLLPAVELSEDFINKITESSLLVKGFDAYKQSEIVATFSKYILDKLAGKEAVPSTEIKNSLKDALEKYQKFYSIKNEKVGQEFTKILDNYEKLFNIATIKLAKFNITIDESEIKKVGEEDQESEFQNYSDDRTFQIDVKDKMSAKLKQFFSFIEHTDRSYIGLKKYLAFDDVINYLSGQLAGIEPNYGKMRAKLEASSESVTWLKNVILALDNADEQTKNQFTSWACKHFANFKMVLHAIGIEKDNKGFFKKNVDRTPQLNYTTSVIDVNQNSIGKVIEKQWSNNLKLTELASLSKVNPGEQVLDANKLKTLNTEFKNLDKTSIEPIKTWLSKLGIEVSTKALEELKSAKRGLSWDKHFTNVNGIFYNIANRLIKDEKEVEGSDSFDLNNPFVNNSAISKLAKLEALHTSAHFSNSHKDGEGKNIYNYIQNKYFTNAFRDIVNNDNDIVNKLLALPFSSTSVWLQELSKAGENVFKDNFEFFYIDTLKKQMGDQDGIKLKNMSSREQELFRMSMFFNQGKKVGTSDKRIIHAISPTLSDKSNLIGITTLGHNTELNIDKDSNYTLGNKTLDALYAIVEGEYKRILSHQDNYKDLNIDGYNPKIFYFFPELNDNAMYPELWAGGKLRISTPEAVSKIKDYLQNYTRELIDRKLKYWNENGFISEGKPKYFDKSYLKYVDGKLERQTDINRLTYAAADYEVNILISNANFFQLFAGDPALFYKKKSGINEDKIQQHVIETWINIGKRLAAEIAPGEELADSDTNKYIQLYLQDRKSTSKNIEQLKELFKNNKALADKYEEITGTDAQEYTTIVEHLYVLEKQGRITSETAKSLLNKANKHALDNDDLTTIFQPVKPVYVQRVIENGVARKIYIKSSSFPLVPQLTKGLEMDKLRSAMEALELKHGTTVRAAYKSAVKLGGSKYTQIYTPEGTIKNELDFTDSMMVLPRSGFRIQQDVPFDATKDEINRGTQEAKLLFANILGIEGMHTLQTEYHNIYAKLFERGKEKLFKELSISDIDGVLTYDQTKLQEKLIREAINRDWPQNDIDALALIQSNEFNKVFALPLWATTSANSIESLLASIVDNSTRKQKLRGNSYVLGSEEGFLGLSNDIVYTKDYNKETGLLPQRYSEDGKTVLPAQILLPNKFRDKNGKIIDLKKFIGEDGLLDTSKFDDKLLEQFGFRIPTQGHNSMSYMKVVGFLPTYMGDLIIAPRDFTVQMGSDFDVDKIYAYMYKTKLEGGKLVKDDSEEAKDINDLLDIHLKVMSHTDKKIQRAILEPLGYGNLEFLAEDIDNKKTARKQSTFNLTPLSNEYQKEKYLKGRVSTSGRGAKSLDSTFSATVQGKDIKLSPSFDKEGKPHPNYLVFGDVHGKALQKNDISSENAVDGSTKLQTHAAYQSAAVDNEKQRIMERINSGPVTYAAERALAQVGFTENFIAPLMSQDIMDDYINELSKASDSLTEKFDPDKETTVSIMLFDKYNKIGGLANSDYDSGQYDEYLSGDYPITQKQLNDCIEHGTNIGAKTYALLQITSLQKFKKATVIGESIAKIQRVINIDSAGIPSHLFDAYDIEKEYNESILLNGILDNTKQLVNNTIPGMALKQALFTNNNLWKNAFPYNHEAIVDIFEESKKLFNKQRLSVDDKYKVFNAIKSFVYSNEQMYLNNDSLRQKLFFDTAKNKSLASRIKELQRSTKNVFIKWLETDIDKNGKKPSLIKYNAGTATNLDELDMYQGFADLFANENTRQIGIDMVNYFFMSGGIQQAIQFGRYVPSAYLLNTPFGMTIRNTSFNDDQVLGNIVYNKGLRDVSKFGKQFVQHYPNRVKRINSDLSEVKNITKDGTSITGFTINEDNAKSLQVKRQVEDGSIITIYPEFLALRDSTAAKKFRLFSYTENNHYRAIDTLGQFGYDEWQFTETNAKSNIEANQTKQLPIPDQKNLTSGIDTAMEESTINPNRSDSFVEKYGLEFDQDLSAKEMIKKALSTISNESSSPLHSELAKTLLNTLDKTGKLNFVTTNNKSIRGSYGYGEKGMGTIIINPDTHATELEFERTLLHEVIHHATGHIIKSENRTKEQDNIVKALNKLQNDLINAINKDAKWKAEFDQFIIDYNNTQRAKGLDEIQISKNYGAIKLTEFVTMALTDNKFQEILNSIETTSKGNLLSRLIDLIKRALKSLGIDIKSGSVLEHAIDQSLMLIDTTLIPESTIEKPTDFLPNSSDMGSTIGEFLQTLSREDRDIFREMLAEGQFKIKC